MRTVAEEAAISHKGTEERPFPTRVDLPAHSTRAEVPNLSTFMPVDDSD